MWLAVAVLAQTPAQKTFQDSGGRFTFAYPASFGLPSKGTNDGFHDRVAAIAFSTFPARFKGEAVLTRGFPMLDLEAAGGLYDAITLEIFPDSLRATVLAQLPRLSASSLCQALGQPTHLDPTLKAFESWTPPQRANLGQVDAMRNARPRVVVCRVSDDVAVFDKIRAFAPGAPDEHVFGAIRFLPEPYSTFQIVAGDENEPGPSTLAAMESLVRSLVFKAWLPSSSSAP